MAKECCLKHNMFAPDAFRSIFFKGLMHLGNLEPSYKTLCV
jgi:hypothetical protein